MHSIASGSSWPLSSPTAKRRQNSNSKSAGNIGCTWPRSTHSWGPVDIVAFKDRLSLRCARCTWVAAFDASQCVCSTLTYKQRTVGVGLMGGFNEFWALRKGPRVIGGHTAAAQCEGQLPKVPRPALLQSRDGAVASSLQYFRARGNWIPFTVLPCDSGAHSVSARALRMQDRRPTAGPRNGMRQGIKCVPSLFRPKGLLLRLFSDLLLPVLVLTSVFLPVFGGAPPNKPRNRCLLVTVLMPLPVPSSTAQCACVQV